MKHARWSKAWLEDSIEVAANRRRLMMVPDASQWFLPSSWAVVSEKFSPRRVDKFMLDARKIRIFSKNSSKRQKNVLMKKISFVTWLQWLHKIQRIFFTPCAISTLTTMTVNRKIFYWFSSDRTSSSLVSIWLFDDGIKKERVYKVISRRIIKHHGMILECLSWWCLASTSPFSSHSLQSGSKVQEVLFMKSQERPHVCIMTFSTIVASREPLAAAA